MTALWGRKPPPAVRPRCGGRGASGTTFQKRYGCRAPHHAPPPTMSRVEYWASQSLAALCPTRSEQETAQVRGPPFGSSSWGLCLCLCWSSFTTRPSGYRTSPQGALIYHALWHTHNTPGEFSLDRCHPPAPRRAETQRTNRVHSELPHAISKKVVQAFQLLGSSKGTSRSSHLSARKRQELGQKWRLGTIVGGRTSRKVDNGCKDSLTVPEKS